MIAPLHTTWDPRVAMRESRSLLKAGHRVALVAMHDSSRKFVEGAEVLPSPHVSPSRWERLRAMRRVYQLARGWPAEVYHAHEVESLIIGLLLKWRKGTKLVWDSHECYHFTAGRFRGRALTGWPARLVTALMARMLRWMSRQADHIVVVSFTNERFYRQFCRRRKVTLLHNSPLPELFPCQDKPPEAARTMTHDGHLSRDRGMLQILEALAIVNRKRPANCLVVGTIKDRDGEPELFEQRARELGLQDNVEVTGWIPYVQVGPALNRGSIGLVAMQPSPNNYGSLSNKLFNYMCTGQAVIGPKGSDTAQVIQEANCGLAVDMTDAQALAEAMLTLIENPDRCRELGRNGRKAVEEKLGWHIMEKQLWQIYEDLEDSSR